MKIIKPGTPKEPKAKPPWWVGRRIICRGCNAVVQLETGDGVREPQRMPGCIREACVDCPSCGRTLSVITGPEEKSTG